MANDYYNSSGWPATSSTGTSSPARAELTSITAGFAKLPGLTGNGSKAVVVNTGGTALTVTTGTLALAGNLATTGAFNTTLVQGATVSITLPTVTGLTLSTLTGTEELDNKTLDSSVGKGTWTASGTWTLPAFTLGGAVAANGQSFTGTIANLGTVTTADINGGTIDGATIGGATPAAATVTTLTANTYVQGGPRNQFTSSDRISVTGATTIFSIATSGSSIGRSGALVLVNGHDTSTTTNTFLDLVLYQSGQTPVVVSQSTTGASARTYSASGGSLQLAMTSGTYTVSSSWVEQAN